MWRIRKGSKSFAEGEMHSRRSWTRWIRTGGKKAAEESWTVMVVSLVAGERTYFAMSWRDCRLLGLVDSGAIAVPV
jgi:hypothetical protein